MKSTFGNPNFIVSKLIDEPVLVGDVADDDQCFKILGHTVKIFLMSILKFDIVVVNRALLIYEPKYVLIYV